MVPIRHTSTDRGGTRRGARPSTGPHRRWRALACAVVAAAGLARDARAEETLAACATTPDLGSVVAAVGGDRVALTVMTRPTEDPHFTPPRPSLIKSLSTCRLFVVNGMGLEVGWAGLLLRQARNGDVLPGAPGYLDASSVIAPLGVPAGPVDRAMGDVHAAGNPHYMLDPVNGLLVARLVSDRLAALRPVDAAYFTERATAFERRLGAALVGERLATKYDVAKLALLAERGRLAAFLREQGQEALLAGWLGAAAPFAGAKVVDDHPIWPYFARRFGLEIVGNLEPRPGIQPTTRHLERLVDRMRAEGVALILASAYYDQRHADFVAANAGATVVRMANQVGARPGTEADYLATADYNVRQVVTALRARAAGKQETP